MKIDAKQRELAKERKHFLISILNGSHCGPPRDSLGYCGPITPERANELLELLARWMANGEA